MLDELGITAELESFGIAAPTYQYRSYPTGEVAHFDLDLIQDQTRHPYRLQVWARPRHTHPQPLAPLSSSTVIEVGR